MPVPRTFSDNCAVMTDRYQLELNAGWMDESPHFTVNPFAADPEYTRPAAAAVQALTPS